MGLLSSEISTKTMVPLCRQLATAYDAGIPIMRSLELVGQNVGDKQAQEVLRGMSESIANGASLGDAARSQEKHLPTFFIQLLDTGDFGGRLDAMLRDLASYYEDRLAMRRQLIGMMVYPIIQLTFAWFLGTFALGLIGQFNLNSTVAFDIWDYINKYLIFQGSAMLIVVTVVAISILFGRFGLLRWVSGLFTNYLWPIKGITRRFALARFFRSMSLLISSGLPIKQCIVASCAVAGNDYVQRDLMQAVGPVSDGATLMQAFGGCKSLTPTAREMLFIGEQSGNLDGSLAKVAEYHQAEAAHSVSVAVKFLGVAIGLFVAAVVGFIVISFYSGYLGMLDDALNF